MKSFCFSIALVFIILFTGCTAELQLTLKNDGNVLVEFNGGAGESFSKMIQAATDTEEVFDVEGIQYELTKAGFSNVNIQTNKTDINVNMIDNGQTYLFKSGLIEKNGKNISAIISRKNLTSLYSLADDQLVQILDLFIAPVFNDEEMSEQEYLELLSSFYGESTSKEVSDSVLKITLIGLDGKKSTQVIPMSKLLCISEEFSLHSFN